MDPLTLIIGALAAGAAASAKDTAAQAIKDAYAGFKRSLIARFGARPELQSAIEQVEKRPESEARQMVLNEELEAAGVREYGDLLRDAEALLKMLEAQGLFSPADFEASLVGSGAIAQGWGAVAAGKGGIAIGRGVVVSPSRPWPDLPSESGESRR
jgi:hypothetical protein